MRVDFNSTYYAADRARLMLSNYYRRVSDYIRGVRYPDPRDQELLDRSIELTWRARVARRELAKPRKEALGRDRDGRADHDVFIDRTLKEVGLKTSGHSLVAAFSDPDALITRQAN